MPLPVRRACAVRSFIMRVPVACNAIRLFHNEVILVAATLSLMAVHTCAADCLRELNMGTSTVWRVSIFSAAALDSHKWSSSGIPVILVTETLQCARRRSDRFTYKMA